MNPAESRDVAKRHNRCSRRTSCVSLFTSQDPTYQPFVCLTYVVPVTATAPSGTHEGFVGLASLS